MQVMTFLLTMFGGLLMDIQRRSLTILTIWNSRDRFMKHRSTVRTIVKALIIIALHSVCLRTFMITGQNDWF